VCKLHTKVLLLFHFRSYDAVAEIPFEASFAGDPSLCRENLSGRIHDQSLAVWLMLLRVTGRSWSRLNNRRLSRASTA
jgi:hypothetical protein